MEKIAKLDAVSNQWGISLDSLALLAKCLLILNFFAIAMYLLWWGLLWLHLLRLEAFAAPVLVCLYFVSLFGFPISVICLHGIQRPKWVTVALFINAPFYVLQLIALAIWLVVELRTL
jgi:hypothetical protein